MLMKASTSKMGENAHKINETITFLSRGLRAFKGVINYERLRFVAEEVTRKIKKVATNKNGLGVHLIPKKAGSCEIGMVVHANKMTCP